jgi:HEAT repeat protein
MTLWESDVELVAVRLLWTGVALAGLMMCAVAIGRVVLAWREARLRHVQRRYEPLIGRAMDGEGSAIAALAASPSRYRLIVSILLMKPIFKNRDPERIAAARRVARALRLESTSVRWLQSRWSRKRILGLRVVGLTQLRDQGAAVVAALDDPSARVRNAALDALADLVDPATLPAFVARLYDTSLQFGRRASVLAALGARAEPALIEAAHLDPVHRLNYARALAISGTGQSRPLLCEWSADDRVEVRAAAFDALGHVGLDDQSGSLAVAALESPEVSVRTAAAGALRGWAGAEHAAPQVARHLDDAWPVAVRAARVLKSIGPAGHAELQSRASQPGLVGALARQMLWKPGTAR